mgnify:FL=1
MNKDMTLLIMAAGMGSRFGGLKQIEPVGPSGEFMIDYSIYDAIKAGFNKVVFIIKEENYDIFEETVGKRIKNYINVEYCFQKINDLPAGYNVPSDRIKPWGTAHAILAAKNNISENFAIINADDFYGRDAFIEVAKFLKTATVKTPKEYAVVGYNVLNTLTENGSVKRGVCEEDCGYLKKLTESLVEKRIDKIVAKPLDGSHEFEVSSNTRVSMNMFGFTPDLFNYIEDNFKAFLEENKDSLSTCEYLIPDLVEKAIKESYAQVKLLETTAKWQGITYREDKEKVVKEINKLIENNIYPSKLWNE